MTSAPYALGVFRRPAAATVGGRDGDSGEITGLGTQRNHCVSERGVRELAQPAQLAQPAEPAHVARPALPAKQPRQRRSQLAVPQEAAR